jgi:hypothetical protein
MFNQPEEVYTRVTQFTQWGEVVIPHPAPVDHDVDFTNAPIIGEIIQAGAYFATGVKMPGGIILRGCC